MSGKSLPAAGEAATGGARRYMHWPAGYLNGEIVCTMVGHQAMVVMVDYNEPAFYGDGTQGTRALARINGGTLYWARTNAGMRVTWEPGMDLGLKDVELSVTQDGVAASVSRTGSGWQGDLLWSGRDKHGLSISLGADVVLLECRGIR